MVHIAVRTKKNNLTYNTIMLPLAIVNAGDHRSVVKISISMLPSLLMLG